MSDENLEDVLSFAPLFQAIKNGKVTIAVCVGAAALVGAFYAFQVATPVYRATSTLQLNVKTSQVISFDNIVEGFSGTSVELNSELQVIQSRGYLADVSRKLDLISDPEFNPYLREKGLLSRLLAGQDADANAVSEAVQLGAVVDALSNKTNVRNVPDSFIFVVSGLSKDPQKAALISQTVSETYIEKQRTYKVAATEEAALWLSDQVQELQKELEASEQRLSEFSASISLPGEEGLDALERQLKETRNRLTLNRSAFQTLTIEQIQLLELEALVNPTYSQVAALTSDRDLIRLMRESEDNFSSPEFVRMLQRIKTSLSQNIARLDREFVALTESEAVLSDKLNQQSTELIAQRQLEREVEANRLLYEHFLTRTKETSSQEGIQTADSRVISNAEVPNFPQSPNRPMIIIFSAFLGGVVSLGWLLLGESSRRNFRSTEEIEQATRLPVIGATHRVRAKSRSDVLAVLREERSSPFAESIRNFRSSLELLGSGNAHKVIMMSSSLPAEGKTTTSISLAMSYAQMGKKVLLVECDLRRAKFQVYFDLPPSGSLVALMQGSGTLDEVATPCPQIGCDVITAGQTDQSPADLFAQTDWQSRIEEMRAAYDIVILDTPPVLLVPDARLMAHYVDYNVLLVEFSNTPRAAVKRAIATFKSSGHDVDGIVLSMIDSTKAHDYYGEGYY
ncbi:GumC family protein [Celeribacter baekdonensis]|nr:polysaccharide biosynthesis tyrosine autokinase [Celeribacter baekdonensis]